MALGVRPDSDETESTFSEMLSDYLASYYKIEHIDTSIIDGKDSLQVHSTYYCLHDGILIVPKKYIWGGGNPKDFVTNNFADKIIIVKNRDTVFNKILKKVDFFNVIDQPLKKYAIIFAPRFNYNKSKAEFLFEYSISIPLTDVGVPAYITINRQGSYTLHDEYYKVN